MTVELQAYLPEAWRLLSESSNLGLKLLHADLGFVQKPLMGEVLLPRSQAL